MPSAVHLDVLSLSQRMRAAAETADWESLTTLGQSRELLIMQLPTTPPRMALTEALKLAEVIQEILDCNSRIQNLQNHGCTK